MIRSVADEQYRDFSARVCGRSLADALPMRVQFELTYRCNIHCVHCYTDPFNEPAGIRRELDLDAVLRIFDEIADAGVLWLTLTGGEAVLHPQFRRIYQEAKRRAFLISLFTNATVVSESLADFLAADPPFTIDVSCHAATAASFDAVTQVSGSFDLFLQGMQRLLDRRLPVSVRTKAMTVNRGELDRIRALVESWGLDFNLFTTIQPRLDGDLSSLDYRLPPDEILDLEASQAGAADCAGSGADRPADPSSVFSPPADDRLFRCGCGTNSCTISPHGILRACTHTTWPAFDLKTMPFAEAFRGLVAEVARARYDSASPCRACQVHALCGKNPVTAVHEAGSMHAPVAHHCDLAFGRAARFVRGVR